MQAIQFEDTLEPLGIAGGALLVLMALGTLVGMPWTTTNGILPAVVQVVGALAMAVIGVGLAWLSYVQS